MGIAVVGIGAVVYAGDRIQIPITFQNTGPASIDESQWRCVIQKQGFGDAPLEGAWVKSGAISKDAVKEVTPFRDVPGDWGGGENISVYLDMELFDSKGAVVVSVKPIKQWDVFYTIPLPAADWVKIISADPMVAQWPTHVRSSSLGVRLPLQPGLAIGSSRSSRAFSGSWSRQVTRSGPG